MSVPDLAQAGSIGSRRCGGHLAAICAGTTIALGMAISVAIGSVPAPAGVGIVALLPAALIDLRERRLPDAWVGAAAVSLLVASLVAFAVGTAPPIGAALVGALVVAGPILSLHLISPTSMGFGDVKAAVVIGLAVGSVDWQLGLVALTLASGSAATTAIATRSRSIAFGPFLVMGAWLALVGHEIWLAPLAGSQVGP